jgi:replication-associated recombination protein RarA
VFVTTLSCIRTPNFQALLRKKAVKTIYLYGMSAAPLAERMRPQNLDELAGQQHLTGKGSILRTAIEQGKLPSMILWGPPGVGKTTIANIIAHTLQVPFYTLSAISSGVKEVREVIEEAKTKPGAILFIDEIHRFNKGQQDALLGAVEKGIIRLIGATTENPSFELKYYGLKTHRLNRGLKVHLVASPFFNFVYYASFKKVCRS